MWFNRHHHGWYSAANLLFLVLLPESSVICKIDLRSLSRLASPLTEIWAANLVCSLLRSRSMTLPLLASLPLHGFLTRPLTTPLPLTQFSARSDPAALTCSAERVQLAVELKKLYVDVILIDIYESHSWRHCSFMKVQGVPKSKLLIVSQ